MNTRAFLILTIALIVSLTAIGVVMLTRFEASPPNQTAGPDTDRVLIPTTLPLRGEPFSPSDEVHESSPVAEDTAEETSELSLVDLRKKLHRPGAWENEALLTFSDAQSLADFIARARALGIEIAGPFGNALTLRAKYGSLEEFQRLLESTEGELPLIGPNYFVSVPRVEKPQEAAAGEGNTPFGDLLFKSLGIPAETDRTAWGKGVLVAVVDSGIGDHPAFRDGQVTRIDLVGEDVPLHGHGTAMASLIAGNGAAGVGISPGANLLDIRIAGENGLSDSYLLAQGIQAAIDNGAQIVNISLGTYGNAPVVESVVADAVKRGILVVAPVGNEKAAIKAWPSAYPGVISVSGVDADGRLAYFSNSGSPTLSAPAIGIDSAYFADHQALLVNGSGTSQSSALVSGVLAHLKARGLDPMRTLTSNARPIQGSKTDFGAGVLFLPASVTR